MKTNCWLVLGTMLATSAVAQVNTNTLPPIPPPATLAPTPVAVAPTNTVAPVTKKKAVVHKKKKAVKKISEPTVALVAGPATVTSVNLNLRGQAGLKGEVIGHLKQGDTVNVITQINLDKHAADEPAQWAKIALPSSAKVWVDTKFVDAASKTVSAKKLNLRAGPGENYSVLGMIEKGTPVSELSAKGDWSQIETPTNAFAFVAAIYLNQSALPAAEPTNAAPPVPETPVVTTPPPTPSTVAEAPAIVTQPAAPVAENNPPPTVAANVPATVPDANAPAPTAATSPSTTFVDTNLPPPPPRIVSHEGYVRPSVSIVAPTYYELYDVASGNAINYLYTTSTNLDLSRYNNLKIIATGEEGLSERWSATPVLTIQKIYVTSTNPPVPYVRAYSPHAASSQRR